MDRFKATCEYVQDGDTFRTAGQNWIRLANVCAPTPHLARGVRVLAEDKPRRYIIIVARGLVPRHISISNLEELPSLS